MDRPCQGGGQVARNHILVLTLKSTVFVYSKASFMSTVFVNFVYLYSFIITLCIIHVKGRPPSAKQMAHTWLLTSELNILAQVPIHQQITLFVILPSLIASPISYSSCPPTWKHKPLVESEPILPMRYVNFHSNNELEHLSAHLCIFSSIFFPKNLTVNLWKKLTASQQLNTQFANTLLCCNSDRAIQLGIFHYIQKEKKYFN